MNNKKIAIIASVVVLLILILLLVFLGNKKYEVKFDTNGGTIVETQKVKKSDKVTKPEDPTKTGYIFDNWYLGNEVFDFSTPIKENITLTAKWIADTTNDDDVEEVTITFDSDGGSKVNKVTIKKNSKVSKPENPTKEGYKFVSWQLDNKDFDFNTEVSKDITLIAKWEKETPKKDNATNTGNTNNNDDNETKPTTIPVSNLTISNSTLSLKVSETKTLTVTVNPSNATNKKITWTSSNTSVATVDNNGKVTAVGTGKTVITATVDGKSITCDVTVEKEITYSVEWVKVEESSIGQYTLYIKSSEGKHVSGTVEITTVANKVSEVNVPTTGVMYIKSAIANATVKSVN